METHKFNDLMFKIYLILGIIGTILGLIVVMPSVKADDAFRCYQALANRSNALDGVCGLNYTGQTFFVYTKDGSPFGEPTIPNSFDGNFSTSTEYGYQDINSTFNTTYNMPKYVKNASLTYQHSMPSFARANVSIPSHCLYNNVVNLSVVISMTPDGVTNGNINYSCYNSTGKTDLANQVITPAVSYFWEMAMVWNIYNFFENIHQYRNITASGSQENFKLNISYDNINYTSTPTASLIYNGINYPAIASGGNGNVLFSRTINVPTVSTETNYSFYWNITIGGSTYQSTTNNQTVLPITMDNCSANTVLIYNFTLRDEATRSIFTYPTTNGTFNLDLILSSYGTTNHVLNFSHSYNSTAQKIVCANVNFSKYRVDMTADYVANGYVKKFYFVDNGTLQNSSIPYNIDLHDLPTADSTTFLFEFTDENGLEVENAIVHTFRKYIGEGIFREVERSKQDNNGQTHVHLVEEDVIYYFMVTQDSNILYTSDTYNAKCLSSPCEISLSASPDETNWSIIDNEGGQYQVTYNQVTRVITLDFNLNGITALVNMSLYKVINGTEFFINYTSLTSASGSMSLTAPIVYGNATFFVVIYNNNTFVKSVWIDLTEGGKDYFGTTGVILGALILLAIMLMAVTEGVGFIVFTVFGLIIIYVMKLVDMGWGSLISIILVGAVIVYKLVKRRQNS